MSREESQDLLKVCYAKVHKGYTGNVLLNLKQE